MNLHGIITRAVNYKEKDKILTLISIEKGKMTILARSVRNKSAKLQTAALPLVYGEFCIVEGKRNILTSAEIKDNYYNCWKDTEKNLASLLVLELLEKVSMENQDVTREILLALQALNEINYGHGYPIAITLWYFLKIAEYIGIDFEDEGIPTNIKEMIEEFSYVNSEDVSSMDLSLNNIDTTFSYLINIFKDNFSINIKVYRELLNSNNFK